MLYTDGIAEALSPDQQIFGEARLDATITATSGGAEALLAAIEAAVDARAA